MLLDFFFQVRKAKVPVTIREFLDLLGALEHKLAFADMDEFYYLSRTVMVKDEKYFDKFDKAFGAFFEGVELLDDLFGTEIPEEWLRKELEKMLTEEEKAQIESLGGFEELMETLKKRLQEQKERHQGGNKWIGTGGTSPFGAEGYNPEGVRIGQEKSRHKKAAKVWEQRTFKDLDDSIALGIRNIQVALRRLRKFAREGAEEILDMDDTIESTAKNAGYLDLKLVPERRNKVKVLLFFDVGGSMDPHVRVCEELFSAAKSEFKHMEYFYFHNCLYESVWKNNLRRGAERMDTYDIIHKYGPDYKVIFVGDASMAPYEITHAGGSVEHWNEEPGAAWMQRIMDHYEKVAWLNPIPDDRWGWGGSIQIMNEIICDQMFPMTIEGMERAMKFLSK
jgi:uncharacterized protein with von Willebrand factor type A (vWA) domain